MLKSLDIKNFTVFPKAHLQFSPQLNVFVGENGTGKSHLLEAIYSVLSSINEVERREAQRNGQDDLRRQGAYLQRVPDKLMGVFRPGRLEELVRSSPESDGVAELTLRYGTQDPDITMKFGRGEFSISLLEPREGRPTPVFFPTRELLSIYPNFVSLFETRYVPFDETWRDTCLLLGAPLTRGASEQRAATLLEPLEQAMGGELKLINGRFYIRTEQGDEREITLVAEGHRKLAMLAQLIANGTLLDDAYLFWDEPEANLNPKLIREIAVIVMHLCRSGVQMFIATHSLFLIRELRILLETEPFEGTSAMFFGLHLGERGVIVEQGADISDIGEITALNEELKQSDRYLEI